MKLNEVAAKAKNGLRKTIRPTNEDRYERARALKQRNDAREARVKSYEAIHAEQRRAERLRERERAVRGNGFGGSSGSGQQVRRAYQMGTRDPFAMFNSDLFSTGVSRASSSGKKKKQNKRVEEQSFPDFNLF